MSGVRLIESAKRSNRDENHLLALRLADRPGVLVTGTPEAVSAVEAIVETMHPEELLSPLGIAEVRRALTLSDSQPVFHGLTYIMEQPEELKAPPRLHPARAMRRADIPPDELELRLSERRNPDEEDFVWSFGCYENSALLSQTVLMWQNPDYVALGVETNPSYRRQGYGASAVHAATRHALESGGVVAYGAAVDNVASLKTARKLGFALAYEILLA